MVASPTGPDPRTVQHRRSVLQGISSPWRKALHVSDRSALLTAYDLTACGVSGVSLIAPGLPVLATRYEVGVDAVAHCRWP